MKDSQQVRELSDNSIFGVRIDDISPGKVRDRATRALRERSLLTIATVNPEIMLRARKDIAYRDALNAHTLNIVDGVGLQKVGGFKYKNTGADLAADLLRIASENRARIVLIVRKDGLSKSENIYTAAHNMAPSAQIFVCDAAPTENATWHNLLKESPQMILVGLGFPAQERWVIEFGKQWFPSAVFLSVGGTFDYWTGAQRRAPYIFQRAYLEWLWRLMMQPRRIMRIVRAVIVFPCTYFLVRFGILQDARK